MVWIRSQHEKEAEIVAQGPVRRNLHNIQLINFAEFFFLRHCGTRHTRKLIIQTEIILKGDCCQRLRFTRNLNGFIDPGRCQKGGGVLPY